MKKYYLHNGSDKIGPFDKEDLLQKGIVKSTLLWAEGNERWTCAENYEDLHDLFFTTPPPIKLQHKPKKIKSWWQIILKWGVALFVVSFITALIIVTLNEVDKEKEQILNQELQQEAEKQIRNTIPSLVIANTNQYSIHGWGGISNLDVMVTNNSNYNMDQVVVEIEYIKKNGGVFDVQSLVIKNIRANDTKSVSAPDSNRGTSVKLNVKNVYSQELNLCYDKDNTIIPGDPDPFLCKK